MRCLLIALALSCCSAFSLTPMPRQLSSAAAVRASSPQMSTKNIVRVEIELEQGEP